MITTATGKTVLVTGGSRGIGAAIAIQLAGIGMNVVINYASNEDAANRNHKHKLRSSQYARFCYRCDRLCRFGHC